MHARSFSVSGKKSTFSAAIAFSSFPARNGRYRTAETVSPIASGRPIWIFSRGTARLLGASEHALFGHVAASYVASAIMGMAVTYLGVDRKMQIRVSEEAAVS